LAVAVAADARGASAATIAVVAVMAASTRTVLIFLIAFSTPDVISGSERTP
jgi:hypothetical protein